MIGVLQQAASSGAWSGYDYRSAIEDALTLELQRFKTTNGGAAQFIGPFEGDEQLDDLYQTALGQTPAVLYRVGNATAQGGRSSRKVTDMVVTVDLLVFSNNLRSMELRQRRTLYALLAELRAFLLGRDIKANTTPFQLAAEVSVDRGDRDGSLWMQTWQCIVNQERGNFPDINQALESVEGRNENIDSTDPPETRVTTLAESS